MNALGKWWVDRAEITSVAEHMWSRWRDAHRMMIPLALSTLGGVERLYELGCGSGPNLRLLQHLDPSLRLGGSDPSPGLAAWASEHLGVHIDQTALPEVPSDRWDCVLTCYTLAYVEPEDVVTALSGLNARALVLLEPMGDVAGDSVGLGYMRDPTSGERVGVPEWHHDYSHLLQESNWRMTWRWPLIPRTHGLNALLIAER